MALIGLPGFGNVLAAAAGGKTADIVSSLAPAATPAAGGLKGLFSNPLFLQLLAAAGTDISKGTGGTNTLAALTQNIGSSNYSKILSSILGGNLPGAKMTADSEGIKLNLPNSSTGGSGGATGTGTTGATGATGGINLQDFFSPFRLVG